MSLVVILKLLKTLKSSVLCKLFYGDVNRDNILNFYKAKLNIIWQKPQQIKIISILIFKAIASI